MNKHGVVTCRNAGWVEVVVDGSTVEAFASDVFSGVEARPGLQFEIDDLQVQVVQREVPVVHLFKLSSVNWVQCYSIILRSY